MVEPAIGRRCGLKPIAPLKTRPTHGCGRSRLSTAQHIFDDGRQSCCALDKRRDHGRDGLLRSVFGDGVDQAEKLATVDAVSELDPPRDLVSARDSTATRQGRFRLRITQSKVEFADARIVIGCELGNPPDERILEAVARCFPDLVRARKESPSGSSLRRVLFQGRVEGGSQKNPTSPRRSPANKGR